MTKRLRRLMAVTAFALAMTSLPSTSLAAPIWAPISSASQPTVADNPLRSLLGVPAAESASMWQALNAVYSDSYVSTACDPPC